MSLAIIECDQEDCEHYNDGYCSATWLEIVGQECMTYAYEGGYEEDDE